MSLASRLLQKFIHICLGVNAFSSSHVDAMPVGEAETTRGVLHRHPLPSNSHPSISSAIVVLFKLCRPTAIIRSVISVNIPAIKCVAIRAFTHIKKKLRELRPRIANKNSTSSVVLVRSGFRVKAPVPHVKPRLVFHGFGSSMARWSFASAAFRMPSFQIGKPCNSFGSAITPNQHHSSSLFRNMGDYCEHLKLTPDRFLALLSWHSRQLP